jgi:hypothetical protein
MSRRHQYVGRYNIPRIEFALHVVENRAIPRKPSEPTDQVKIANDFLASSRLQGDAELTPRELAISDKPLAAAWLTQGLAAAQHLYDLLRSAPATSGTARSQMFATACEAHFKIQGILQLARDPESAASRRARDRLKLIRDTFQLMLTLFPIDNRLRNGRVEYGGAPAYAYWNGAIFFTRFYRTYDANRANGRDIGYGRTARAAMLIHEYVHVVNRQSGQHDIPEWDARYHGLPPERAIHNPSSYSAFAQHVCYGLDTSYGAGHRNIDRPIRHSCVP